MSQKNLHFNALFKTNFDPKRLNVAGNYRNEVKVPLQESKVAKISSRVVLASKGLLPCVGMGKRDYLFSDFAIIIRCISFAYFARFNSPVQFQLFIAS